MHLPDRGRVEPDLHDLRHGAARSGASGAVLGQRGGVMSFRGAGKPANPEAYLQLTRAHSDSRITRSANALRGGRSRDAISNTMRVQPRAAAAGRSKNLQESYLQACSER